jgi:hypothetical protein
MLLIDGSVLSSRENPLLPLGAAVTRVYLYVRCVYDVAYYALAIYDDGAMIDLTRLSINRRRMLRCGFSLNVT